MLVLGVTGLSGAGKSFVARLLKRRGATVVNVDSLARSLYAPGQSAHRSLKRLFGIQICHRNGRVNRKALAAVVFSDKKKLKALNALMYPLIRQALAKRLRVERARRTRCVVLDMAVLFDARAEGLTDAVILVEAPLATRVRRLVQGRGLEAQRALRQARAMRVPAAWRLKSDLVLDNRGDAAGLNRRLDAFLSSIAPSAFPNR